MAKKYEKYLPSLAFRGRQIKTPLTFPLTPVKITIKDKVDDAEDVGTKKASHTPGESVDRFSHCGNQSGGSQKN